MGIDLSVWEPGLVFGLIVVLGLLATGLLISALSVGLVQWRKVRTLNDMREFVQQLIDQGYSIEEIERLAGTFFESRPGQGVDVKRFKSPAG